jgi:DNA-binding Lrp family transcriptional regulator
MTWSELADAIGLSQTPTLRRVRALETDGYIKGYRALIDEAKLGLGISIFVSVSLEKQTDQALARFEEAVTAIPTVMDCYMMTGSTDYLLRAVLSDIASMQSFVSEITRVPGVARVSTSFAVKSVLQRAAPPLDCNRKRQRAKPHPS